MNNTAIEWAEKTWNPVTGCSPVSEGCEHCYAERMSKRLRGRCGYPEDEPFKVTLHPDRLEQPLSEDTPDVVRWFAYYRGLESDEIAAVVNRPREVIEELLEVAP